MTVAIRALDGADADAYFRLRTRSEQEFPQFVGFNAERELNAGANGLAALLDGYAAEGTTVLGAFDRSALLGVVVLSRRLSPKYRHKMFLWGMYVFESWRGAGIAQALMQAALGHCRSLPEVIAVMLQVTVSNQRGRRFYERFGFGVFGTERRSLMAAGSLHDAHYMELDLDGRSGSDDSVDASGQA